MKYIQIHCVNLKQDLWLIKLLKFATHAIFKQNCEATRMFILCASSVSCNAADISANIFELNKYMNINEESL